MTQNQAYYVNFAFDFDRLSHDKINKIKDCFCIRSTDENILW